MFEKSGTCCPTCGKRQAHVHLGWLKISKEGNKLIPEVLFTQVNCDDCGHTSIIVRFVKEQDREVYKELDAAVRKVFEKRSRNEVH